MSDASSKRERIDWADVPFVFVLLPTCPACGSPDYEKVRTESNGDGSVTRKAICRACGEPYKICVELPDSGNLDF